MIQVSRAQPRAPLWAVLARAGKLLNGAPDVAAEIAREALHFAPAEPHALLVLVSAMRVCGERIAAQAFLERLVAECPGIAAPHCELGLLLAEEGDAGAAVQCFSRVVELEPQHPAAWRALGDELARSGDLDGAKKAWGNQFDSSVRDVLMLEQVAGLGADQIDGASAMLRAFLTVHPTDVTATRMLGESYIRANRRQAAEALFARTRELAPGLLPVPPGCRLSAMLLTAAQRLQTDPAVAAADAAQMLRFFPGQQQALLLLACARRAAGETEKLRSELAALADTYPSLASVQYELGLLFASLGDRQEAIARLLWVVALEPNHPAAWRALGNQRSRNDDGADAAEAYAHHIDVSLKELKLLEDACAEESAGAEDMLRQSLAVNPTDVMTLRLLAQKEHGRGRNRDAASLLETALRLAPASLETRKDYAFVLQQDMDWLRSNVQFDLVLAAEPENAMAVASKASNLVLLGEHAQALELLEQAGDALANDPSYWLSYGNALRTAGKGEAAIAAYRRCLEIDPAFALAWWALANMKTFRFAPGETDRMLALSKRGNLLAETRCHIEFSLGKAFEDAEMYERAFAHYRRANDLRRPRMNYSREEFGERVEKIKSLFTAEFFRRREGAGCTSAGPIFIVGMPRAGSTLIEQILASHSEIEGTGELPDLVNVVREAMGRYPGLMYPDVAGRLNANDFRSLGELYIESTRPQRKLGRRLFTDKAPRNFQYVGLIHLILPNATIIDARRHPMACGFSGYKQCFRMGSMPHTYSLQDIGKHYRLYVELMAHYDAVLPGRVHRVIHEELLRDPEAEIRRLLAFCGVAFEERCLRFHEADRGVRTSSSEQVRRPIETPPVEPWRHFEPWLDPLKAALGPVLENYPAVPDSSDFRRFNG